jgi:hypothetical protein
MRARIDDVVAWRSESSVRVVTALTERAVIMARDAGAHDLKLTSRPSLVEVNAAYVEIGFVDLGSGVYTLPLAPDERSAPPRMAMMTSAHRL